MTKLDWVKMKERSKAVADRPGPSSTHAPPLDGGAGLKKFGRCPSCGSCKWWDNTGSKVLGAYKKTAPDASCASCGHKIWPS